MSRQSTTDADVREILEQERDALKVAVSRLQEENEALRARLAGLDERFVALAAQFAGEQARKAVEVALRSKLAPAAGSTPTRGFTLPREDGAEVRARLLDLDPVETPASRPSDAERQKVVAAAKAAREAAHAEAVKAVNAPKEPLLTDARLITLVEEVAATPPLATQERRTLARCQRCRSFTMGKHTCR